MPQALQTRYPQAKIAQLDSWATDFNGTYFLDPTDPLFKLIAIDFVQTQRAMYGSDHLYTADPFNEMTPPTTDTTYLAGVGRAIYESMSAADTDALWVMQGVCLCDVACESLWLICFFLCLCVVVVVLGKQPVVLEGTAGPCVAWRCSERQVINA